MNTLLSYGLPIFGVVAALAPTFASATSDFVDVARGITTVEMQDDRIISTSESQENRGVVEPEVDLDDDGVADGSDNCILVSNADQRDTNEDGYGNACDPDLDNSGVVNFGDYTPLTAAFQSSPGSPNWNEDADFNGDGVVNFADIALFPVFFLGVPGPSGLVGPQLVWQPFSDPMLSGITIHFPTFGNVLVEFETIDVGITVVQVSAASEFYGNELVKQFSIAFTSNGSQLSLQDWFEQTVDDTGLLLSVGTYTLEMLGNGMSAYVQTGPVPSEYGEAKGPVTPIYAISPSGDMLVSANFSHDNEWGLNLGTTDAQAPYALAVIRGLQF